MSTSQQFMVEYLTKSNQRYVKPDDIFLVALIVRIQNLLK